MYLEQNMVLHAPKLSTTQRNGLISVVDPSGPNWMVTDARGAKLMSWVDGHKTVAEIVERYRGEFGGEVEKAKLHVDRFLRAASRRGFVSSGPDGAKGPPLAFLLDAAKQAKELGVQTFSLTGGEPFARPDLPEL